MRTITLTQLTEAEACEGQTELFKKHFGKSVVVTEELAESLTTQFSFDWAARNLLIDSTYVEYLNVTRDDRQEYEKVRAAAQVKYDQACSDVWAKYRRTQSQSLAWNVYGTEYDAVNIELKETRAAARLKHDKVCAVTFAKLYNADS